ncbi:MAG: Glutamate--tRNA ligase [Nitrosopumilales archaeon]|nr:MAG: Glutamate--tRNA ligase [Nitrosopumilales archaeon]
MDEKLSQEIRKIALQNASEHNGQTREKIVLARILGSHPDLRNKIKNLSRDVSEIINVVNKLSIEEQRSKIEQEFPDLLKAKPKQEIEKTILPPLEEAKNGMVVTRFPPEPNGYPHIGHAKAAIIDEEYAKMYGGKMILRFDDTNPANERMEYYAAIKVGLDWLGIKYDKIKNTSDDLELIYDKGLHMIKSGQAYVCTCKAETVSENRKEKKPCKCRSIDQKQTVDRWEKMFEKYKPGEAIVRFRGNMNSENTVMRDPVLFRIIDSSHALLGNKYRVWPGYDFATAIEDSVDGITHALRTKEYELRNELYYAILDALQMRKPKVLEFSRLEFEGMPVSKRVLKQLIDEGKIPDYEDPRIPTLEGLKRRGILPDAIRKFVLSLGFTKADTTAPFDVLESFNRKMVDSKSIRLNMVKEPVKLIVSKIPFDSVTISNHPTVDMGKRKVVIDGNFYISKKDANELKVGSQIRLMNLGNVSITKSSVDLEGEFIDDNVKSELPKIQWVPQKSAQKISIIIPGILFINDNFNENSLEITEGYTEDYYSNLKVGDEIQFIRFGYCRKDSATQVIFTHK